MHAPNFAEFSRELLLHNYTFSALQDRQRRSKKLPSSHFDEDSTVITGTEITNMEGGISYGKDFKAHLFTIVLRYH